MRVWLQIKSGEGIPLVSVCAQSWACNQSCRLDEVTKLGSFFDGKGRRQQQAAWFCSWLRRRRQEYVPGVPVVLPPRHAARTWGSLPTLFPSGVTGPGGPPGRHHRHTVRPPTVPRVDRHRNRHVRAATHSHTPATGERARSRRQLAVWPAWSCSRRLGARRATLPRRHRPRQAGQPAGTAATWRASPGLSPGRRSACVLAPFLGPTRAFGGHEGVRGDPNVRPVRAPRPRRSPRSDLAVASRENAATPVATTYYSCRENATTW